MGKIGWIINALLVVAIVVMTYVFIFKGSVEQSDDGRTAILVTAGERDYILEEMRGFLEAVESITSNLADSDKKALVEAARKEGMTNMSVPAALLGKLPLEFKTLGIETHKLFDVLAEGVEAGDNDKAILTKLSDVLTNCTTCHSGYRLGLEKKSE